MLGYVLDVRRTSHSLVRMESHSGRRYDAKLLAQDGLHFVHVAIRPFPPAMTQSNPQLFWVLLYTCALELPGHRLPRRTLVYFLDSLNVLVDPNVPRFASWL